MEVRTRGDGRVRQCRTSSMNFGTFAGLVSFSMALDSQELARIQGRKFPVYSSFAKIRFLIKLEKLASPGSDHLRLVSGWFIHTNPVEQRGGYDLVQGGGGDHASKEHDRQRIKDLLARLTVTEQQRD